MTSLYENESLWVAEAEPVISASTRSPLTFLKLVAQSYVSMHEESYSIEFLCSVEKRQIGLDVLRKYEQVVGDVESSEILWKMKLIGRKSTSNGSTVFKKSKIPHYAEPQYARKFGRPRALPYRTVAHLQTREFCKPYLSTHIIVASCRQPLSSHTTFSIERMGSRFTWK